VEDSDVTFRDLEVVSERTINSRNRIDSGHLADREYENSFQKNPLVHAKGTIQKQS
jgi:hypothetical protein